MPNNSYRQAEGLNWSLAKHMLTSPRQYLHAIENPVVQTPAMAFGTAVHAAILEPDDFDELHVVVPDEFVTASGALSTAKYAKEWIAQQKEGAMLLTAPQAASIEAIKANIAKHKAASDALEKAPNREQGLYWTDAATGIDCKCCPDAHNGFTVIDVKTWAPRGKFSADSFMREAVSRGYLGQLGFYAMGILGATGHKVEAMQFLVLQSVAPFDVMLLELDYDAMSFALDEARNALDAVADWIEAGRPDEGAEPELVICNLPWRKNDAADDGSDLEGL